MLLRHGIGGKSTSSTSLDADRGTSHTLMSITTGSTAISRMSDD